MQNCTGNSLNSNPTRANAILRLQRLRMKRKAEAGDDEDSCCLVSSPRRSRTYRTRIPVPPTPPPREVNATKMQFLFEKRLKYSDIKEEGRIVVPKAFAEKYMPTLESKEGFYMFMDDMVAIKNWKFRYRYWPNNSSRVYVLENTGEFIKAYGLQIGDFIMFYKDKESQSFAIGTRKSDDGKDDDREDEEDQVSPINTALPISKHNLLVPNPHDQESGSTTSATATSCHPGRRPHDDQCCSSTSSSAAAAATASEYSGGLKGFPFQLLKMDHDSLDLPEY